MSAASTLGVEPITNFVHSEAEVEAAMAALGQAPNSGLIVAPETFTTAHRKLFIALAERNRVPAIYGLRQFAATGGLMSTPIPFIGEKQLAGAWERDSSWGDDSRRLS